MDFPFPFIDKLIIPADATANDTRIEIDGTTGSLSVYDSNGNLRIVIGGKGSNSDNIGTYTTATDQDEGGTLGSNKLDHLDRLATQILSPRLLFQSDRARIDIMSPVRYPGTNRGKIRLTSVLSPGVDIELDAATLTIQDGSNCPMGTVTLVGGTVTVNHTRVTANTRIFTSRQALGGTPGHLYIANVIPGTSFDIVSSSATDASTVAYLLIDPG